MDILFVGLGGFIGACSRYLLTKVSSQIVPSFPLGTLLSNVIAGGNILLNVVLSFFCVFIGLTLGKLLTRGIERLIQPLMMAEV